MALVYSAESGVLNSPCTKKLRQLLTWSENHTRRQSSSKDKKKESSTKPPSMMMFEPSMERDIEESWILCLADSHAKTSRWQVRERVLRRILGADSSSSSCGWFAKYDPHSSSWRTCQQSLSGEWIPYSQKFLKQGMMLGGRLYGRVMWEPDTGVKDGSALVTYPTPQVSDVGQGTIIPWERLEFTKKGYPFKKTTSGHIGGVGLAQFVGITEKEMWPTPTQRDYKDGSENMVGKAHLDSEVEFGIETPQKKPKRLSPLWVEWLMGFPKGWTDLNASATRWFPNRGD